MSIEKHYWLCYLLFILPVFAKSGGVDPVNKALNGLALRGYDAVSYFTQAKPVEGRAEFQHKWQDAVWQFSSAANHNAFAKNPEKYAPQFGGYCAYAVSHGYTADGDPQIWKIVNGKLYLNYNQEARQLWEKDISGNIAKGDENWPKFLKQKPEHKG
jgi:YHS domain-containing protein